MGAAGVPAGGSSGGESVIPIVLIKAPSRYRALCLDNLTFTNEAAAALEPGAATGVGQHDPFGRLQLRRAIR